MITNLEIYKCIAYFDAEGTLVIKTQISVLTPKAINELDLRQKLVKGLADAYLDHYNQYNDPDGQEELNFFWRLMKNRTEFCEDQRNPKSTENNNEII